MSIITYISSHWVEIGAAIGLIMGGARIIVKLTPTPKDDTILEKIIGLLRHVGLNVTDKKPE
jgi:hypothetical protein